MRRYRVVLCLLLTAMAGAIAPLAASAAAKPTTSHEALVATGENYPDALVAAVFDEPIILTEANQLTSDARAGLETLHKGGVEFVTIIGGTAAISNGVARAIGQQGFQVQRIGGADRYETATQVAAHLNSLAGIGRAGGLRTALIVKGDTHFDGLAVGPLSSSRHLPILWVRTRELPQVVASAVDDLRIKQVLVVGGTAAVSSLVEAQLVAQTGQPAKRLAGRDRFETAHAVSRY